MASALHQKSEYDELHRLMAYADAQLKPRAAALLQQWEQQTSGLAPPPTAWSARAFQDAIVEFHDVRARTKRLAGALFFHSICSFWIVVKKLGDDESGACL